MEVCRNLRTDGQLVASAHGSEQFQSFNRKTAVVKAGVLRLVRHADVQMELLQGPGVGLGHALAGGSDEGLGVKQSWR